MMDISSDVDDTGANDGGGKAGPAAAISAQQSVPDGEEHEGCRVTVAALRAEVAGLKQRLKDVMGGVPICES